MLSAPNTQGINKSISERFSCKLPWLGQIRFELRAPGRFV
jgi:hypothetical protein